MSSRLIDPNEDLSQDKSFTEIKSENVIQTVTKATDSIRKRLEELMFFEQGEETKMSQLINTAKNPEYLSCMDPSFYPWM